MQVKIEDRFLGEVANSNKVSGKSPYPDTIIKAYKELLSWIIRASSTDELRKIKSLHFEKLKGKKYEGKYSMRLNISYRLIFRVENEQGSKIEIICIEEINNHYS